MSTVGVRSVGRVPAEPRRVSIDLPRESVNESEAESERASDPRNRRRDAARRTAPRRAAIAISLENAPRVVGDDNDDNRAAAAAAAAAATMTKTAHR
ncbi:hypothetical protein P5V15_003695 [Pogonomyrmex californicus]